MAVPITNIAAEILKDAQSSGAPPGIPAPVVNIFRVPDPLNPQRRIPDSARVNPLEVEVDVSAFFPSSGFYTEVCLCWISVSLVEQAGYVKIDYPASAVYRPVKFNVPVALMQKDGPFTLIVVTRDSAGNTDYSTPLTVLIDTIAPNLGKSPAPLVFVDPQVKTPGINEAYLALNPLIRCTIPTYLDRKEGDSVHIIFSSSKAPPVFNATDINATFALTTTPQVVDIEARYFFGLVTGPVYAHYKLSDRYGNFGDTSIATEFTVRWTNIDFPAPQISPLYNAIINRRSARETVYVSVTDMTTFLPGDQVEAFWGAHSVGAQSFTGTPLRFPVPWLTLRANGLGPLTLPIKYVVYRGADLYNSKGLNVQFDGTIAGQDHPNAPALLNSLLAPAEFYGADITRPNRLFKTDVGAPVNARVRLYQTPKAGEVISLNINGLGPVAAYIVRATDVAGGWINFPPIPWSWFAGFVGNTVFTASYTTDNKVNQQLSPDTFINLIVAPLPAFKAPEILGTKFNGYLRCLSTPPVWEGVGINVKDPQLQVGDIIDLTWTAYLKVNWVSVIASTVNTFTFTIESKHLAPGYVLTIPYKEQVYPARNKGSAEATYTVMRAGRLIGESPLGKVLIDMIDPGTGKPCGPIS